jgi:hypothetical protein
MQRVIRLPRYLSLYALRQPDTVTWSTLCSRLTHGCIVAPVGSPENNPVEHSTVVHLESERTSARVVKHRDGRDLGPEAQVGGLAVSFVHELGFFAIRPTG